MEAHLRQKRLAAQLPRSMAPNGEREQPTFSSVPAETSCAINSFQVPLLMIHYAAAIEQEHPGPSGALADE